MEAGPMRSFDSLSESEQGELLGHYARIVEILRFSRDEAEAIERLVRLSGDAEAVEAHGPVRPCSRARRT
jgi:hypothetical protein